MRKILSIIALLSSAAVGAPAAHADAYYFTISGADSGSIAITESSGFITGIIGTFDGSTIGSLLPIGGTGANDNRFSLTAPYVDGNGVAFSLTTTDSNGWDYVNLNTLNRSLSPPFIYGSVQGNSPEYDVGSFALYSPDFLTPVATPEPTTLLLIGTGLLGMATYCRRGRKV